MEAGCVSVSQEFRAFSEWLSEHRSGELGRLERIANGFEGWLKVEFLLWLTCHRDPVLRHAATVDDDVGLEHSARLQQVAEMDRGRKLCDLWIRSTRSNYFHYVEFKAPFAEYNSGKIISYAASDLWYVSRLAPTEAAHTGNLIVFGVRYAQHQWSSALEEIRSRAEHPGAISEDDEGVLGPEGGLRWAILTQNYMAG